MVETVQDVEKQLETVIKWTPEFERGYDWDKFYFDNSKPPVICYGTSSSNIERIKKEGIKPQGKKSNIVKLSGLLHKLSKIEGMPVFSMEKFINDAERTYLTFAPGIAWCYAYMAGENRRNICSYANEALGKAKELNLPETELISEIKKQAELLENEKSNGAPALVLVQTNLEIFEKSGLLSELLNIDGFFRLKSIYRNRYFSKFSQEMFVCAGLRYLNSDLSFQVPLTDDEIYTTAAIPSEDIVDVFS